MKIPWYRKVVSWLLPFLAVLANDMLHPAKISDLAHIAVIALVLGWYILLVVMSIVNQRARSSRG